MLSEHSYRPVLKYYRSTGIIASYMKEDLEIKPFLTPDMVGALGQIDAANSDISNQNTRLGRVGEIGVQEVEELVRQGIAEEQCATIEARDEAATAIPYAAWGTRRAELSRTIDQLDEDIATAVSHDPSDDPRYKGMIQLAVELAPTQADAIRTRVASLALAELEPILEEFRQELEGHRREAEALDAALMQTGTAWPIPLAMRASPEQPVGAEAGWPAVDAGIALGERGVAVALRRTTEAAPPPEPEEQAPETRSLTTEAMAVMTYASQAGAFRLEAIRRAVPEIAALSDEDYKTFRLEFRRIREQIIQALAAEGTTAHWVESGQTRGRTYQLTVTERLSPAGSATAAPETETSSVGMPAEPAPLQESVSPEEIRARKTLGLADELIRANDGKPVRREQLVKALSDASDLNMTEARRYVKELIRQERLFVAAKAGPSVLISTSSPEQPAGVPEPQANGEKKPRVDTETCLRVARFVFTTLSAARHHTQGKQLASIATHPELGGVESANRRAMRRLESLGFLAINTTRRGSKARSGGAVVAQVYFPSAQQKDAWKNDPNVVLTEIRAALEADDAIAGHEL
jgi:hypothetical protein